MKNMLGNNEVLRTLWCGPLFDLVSKLNSERGEEYEGQLKKMLSDELMPIPVSLGTAGITVVKTIAQRIGGGRTTDQIVAEAKKVGCSVSSNIKPKNLPVGYGRARVGVLEFFQFNYEPTTLEVQIRCEESGYGYPTYEDGLRFQEDHPDDQRQAPHIFIPENPWFDARGYPQALNLWGDTDDRELDLNDCHPECRWNQHCVFARRKSLRFSPIINGRVFYLVQELS